MPDDLGGHEQERDCSLTCLRDSRSSTSRFRDPPHRLIGCGLNTGYAGIPRLPHSVAEIRSAPWEPERSPAPGIREGAAGAPDSF